MIKAAEEQVAKGNLLGEDFRQSVRIEQRPHGRKAYFTVLGFGPGGSVNGGFSFHARYDLLVTTTFNGEDDSLPEERLKDPINPRNDLPALVRKVEEFLEANTNAGGRSTATAGINRKRL